MISARLDHVFGQRLKSVEGVILTNYAFKGIEPQVNQTVQVWEETYLIKEIVPVYHEQFNSHYIVVSLES